MRSDQPASVVTTAAQAAAEAATEKHEPRMARALERELRGLVREVVEAWERTTRTVHASAAFSEAERRFAAFAEHDDDWVPPRYSVPVDGDLYDEMATNEKLAGISAKYRADATMATGEAMGGELAIEFDVTNRLLRNVIARQGGMKIVTAPTDVVAPMMRSLQASYDAGHSIPKAARLMRKVGYQGSKSQAARIARTELVRAVNGASLAVVKEGTNLEYKTWIAEIDDRTRDDHIEADGQVVPIDEPFLVGGEELDYPGDDAGSEEQVINCRCTIGYAESASTTTIGGASMATTTEPDTETTTGADWAGVIAQEGVDTGDGRRIAENALNWRALPLTLMSQLVTPEYGGHTDAMVAGRIDAIDRADSNIVASGVFDSGEHGSTTERMVREQVLRGVSVDLAVNEAEVIPAEDVEDPMEAWFMGTLVVLDGTILGATVVPFPAFENANIAIVAGAAMRLSRPRWELVDGERTMVVSFYMPFAPPMAADDDEPPDEPKDEDAEEAVADIRDTVNLWPGLDGEVVVTIDGSETTIPFPAEMAEDESATHPREVQAALATLRAYVNGKDHS